MEGHHSNLDFRFEASSDGTILVRFGRCKFLVFDAVVGCLYVDPADWNVWNLERGVSLSRLAIAGIIVAVGATTVQSVKQVQRSGVTIEFRGGLNCSGRLLKLIRGET